MEMKTMMDDLAEMLGRIGGFAATAIILGLGVRLFLWAAGLPW